MDHNIQEVVRICPLNRSMRAAVDLPTVLFIKSELHCGRFMS